MCMRATSFTSPRPSKVLGLLSHHPACPIVREKFPNQKNRGRAGREDRDRQKCGRMALGTSGNDAERSGGMPKNPKTLDNLSKHLTKAEADARVEAEAKTLPTRKRVTLTPPPYLRKDALAIGYWRKTLKRIDLDGLDLLDDLDTETMALYCTMLSRRDRLNTLCDELLRSSLGKDSALTPEEKLKATDKLDSLARKLGALERTLITYADKLGMTPASRTAISRRRAAAEDAAQADDLYGD